MLVTTISGSYHQLLLPGPADASSKPTLLLPAEDREDPGARTQGLPDEGSMLGHLGCSESQPRRLRASTGDTVGPDRVGTGCVGPVLPAHCHCLPTK